MIIYITIIIAGIVLDQLTKYWANTVLSGMTTYSIIPNVLHFTYVENTGAAFNIFSDKQIFLIIITLIFIIILGYLFFLLPKTRAFNLANLALSLMLSGAIGNLIDRVTHSYVIDFIDLRIINFAVFNVADSLVVIGALLLLYAYLKNQLVVPAKISQSTTETKKENEETEDRPFRKDVLKDLKPKPVRRDLKPDVRTEIIKLKSVPAATPVEEYQPKTFFDDYSSLYDDLLSETSDISFTSDNKYSEQTDHYKDSLKKYQDENLTDRESKLRTRYQDRINHYEQSVNKLREETARENNKEETVWYPEVTDQDRQKKSYEIDWNPQFSQDADKARVRFKNQIDHYAQSIKEQKEALNKSEHEKEIEEEVKEEIKIERKNPKNRYQELTESYINSIEEVKKKQYTNQENEE